MTQTAEIGQVPEWTLGWRLQRALAQSGLKAGEMAQKLGVSRGTVSRWMNDRGEAPKAAFINQWALATGVPVEWLLKGTQARPPKGPDGGSAAANRVTKLLLNTRVPFATVDPGLVAA